MKILLLLFLSSIILLAEVAKISSVVGDATIQRSNETIIVKIGTLVEKKDIIKTKSNSKVQLIFTDNTVVTLGKSSALDINDYLYDPKNPQNSKTDLNFFKGAFKTITGKIGKINKKKFKLRTKSSTIGIRGTVILANQSTIVCLSGEISVSTGQERVIVPQNKVTTVQNGKLSEPEAYTQDTLQNLSNSLEPEDKESSNSNNEEDSSDTSSKESESSEPTSNNEESQEETSSQQESSSDGTNSDDSNISQEDSSIAPTEETTSSSTDDTSSGTTASSSTSASETITEVAEAAIEDEDSKAVEPDITTLSLEGFALGSYVDTSSSVNSYSQEDTSFVARRVDNKISFDESLTRKYSNSSSSETISVSKSKTFTLGTPSSGGYTGHSDIGTLDFSYSSNGAITNTGTYKIQADNMGEIFVLYHDGSLNGTAEFNELIVFGNKGDISKADKTKIYVYKDFASMKVEKDSSGNFTESKLDTTENGYEYYNPYLNSMTHLNSDYYKQGAEEFIVGTNGKIKVYRNKYNFTYNSGTTTPLNMNSYNYGSNTADITFIGTDLQGISYNLNTSSSTKNYSTNLTTTTTSQNSGASFLEKDLMSTAKTTGSSALSGFIVAEGFQDIDSSQTFRKKSSDFTLNIDRSSGKITGDSIIGSTTGSANGMTLKFNGEVASETSFYINDDIFGVMFDKGDSNYKVGVDEYDLVDNSGYLIAVPDGALDNGVFKFFDANDNPLMSEDDSSWGYWTAKFDASAKNAFVSPYSTWVAGVKTPDSVINPILSGTSTNYSFEGGIIGTVLTSSGNVESIITDGTKTNIAKMTFDLGAGNSSMTSGVLGFSTTNTTWDLSMSGNSVSNSGFSGTLGGNANGTFQGKFYGQDSIKSVGGSFSATKQNASTGVVDAAAQGVFKAIKK